MSPEPEPLSNQYSWGLPDGGEVLGDLTSLPFGRRDNVQRNVIENVPAEDNGTTGIEIKLGDVRVHRAPAAVTDALRYLLTRTEEMPARLAVTSAIHGEGTTTISRTLAALIANDFRQSTCWIDLNWAKSKRARREAGLVDTTIMDVLQGSAPVDSMVMPTSIPGLSFASSGSVAVGHRPMVARSSALRELIDDLGKRFDHIILDLPPVLATSDTLTLGHLADAYLLVVRYGTTPVTQVRGAMHTMAAIPNVGAILNAVETHVPRWLRPADEGWSPGYQD